MRKKRIKRRIIVGIITITILILGWFSFGPTNINKSQNTIAIGVVAQSKDDAKIWQTVAKKVKKEDGITLIFKNFSDYNQPNKALQNGDIDMNAFQHQAYLNTWNKENHGDLVCIGKTYLAPIRLYSKKYHSIKEIPDNATIAIPNDVSNEARALEVLQDAKLISLKKKHKLPSLTDIDKNPHNFKFKELSAEQLGRLINSVDAAVVNNDYALQAGLSEKQTLYVEPINKQTEQWINIIAVKKSNLHNKIYQKVVKAYQTKETQKLYKKYYGNMQIAGWNFKAKD